MGILIQISRKTSLKVSSLSPVLMNIFQHRLDLQIHSSFMKKDRMIDYVRCADDMIIAIKSGVDSEKIYNRFWNFFISAARPKAGRDIKHPCFYLSPLPRTSVFLLTNSVGWVDALSSTLLRKSFLTHVLIQSPYLCLWQAWCAHKKILWQEA